MSRIRLTDTTVERLPGDRTGKAKIYWDSDLKGFGLKISGKKKTRIYVVQRELKGKTRRVTIGPANVLPAAKARERAMAVLADMYKGIDPKEKKKAGISLKDALNQYLRARKDLKPRTAEFYRQAIEKNLADWLYKPLADITADMVEDRHKGIVEQVLTRHAGNGRGGKGFVVGTYAANGAMKSLRAIWNFTAESTPTLGRNPVSRLKRRWFPEAPRQRVLTPDQMPAFYRAAHALDPTYRDYVLLLLLFTGLRRNEAARLTWSEVDFANSAIRLPASRTKANRKLDLPMSDVVRDLFKARRAVGIESDYVFPANSESGHLEEPRPAFVAIKKATEIWMACHDMRRTFVTTAALSPVSPLVLKALVNHALGNDITAGYVVLGIEDLRPGMQIITDRLKALCTAKPDSLDLSTRSTVRHCIPETLAAE